MTDYETTHSSSGEGSTPTELLVELRKAADLAAQLPDSSKRRMPTITHRAPKP